MENERSTKYILYNQGFPFVPQNDAFDPYFVLGAFNLNKLYPDQGNILI